METVGSRVKFRRRQLKMTQKDVAELVGISASAVTQWESDSTGLSAENLLKLSSVLKCNPKWLLLGYGDPDENVPFEPSEYNSVPIISWVQAGSWADNFCEMNLHDYKYIKTSINVSNKAFALIVKGQSMTATNGDLSIPEGAIVIVEPDYGYIDDINGKIIVAQQKSSNEATIKKLIIDGPNKYLAPLNPQFNPIQVNGDCIIAGKVKQVIINLN
ncbi:MAG: LexA family protein [Providencia sp.]|uniref:LexA family protein n=1 Tax=Providencia sp. TaxID=589 RepID=UPI003F94E793